MTFTSVSTSGITQIQQTSSGTPPPSGFEVYPPDAPVYYDVVSTAQTSGSIIVCLTYDPAQTVGPESDLRLYHYAISPPGWEDVTWSLDTAVNQICGQVTSLSPFIVVKPLGCCLPGPISWRGDVDQSGGNPSLADLSKLISYLKNQPGHYTPPCMVQANVDGLPTSDSNPSLADLSKLISYLKNQPGHWVLLPCP